jgi:hypothetical protein
VTPLPPDWRARVVALLTAPDADPEAEAAWWVDDPRRPPARQAAIYREQIALRLRRVLASSVPALAAYEGPAFDALAGAYLLDHPPTSWALARLADALPAWLAAHPTGDPARDADRRDLAALDLAVGRARRAADTPPLGAVTADTPLALGASVTVLSLERPWHAWRRAVLADGATSIPARAPTTVVLYRRAGEVRDQPIDVEEGRFLLAFAQARSLSQAVATLAADHPEPAALLPRVASWFQRFAERGWLGPAGAEAA